MRPLHRLYYPSIQAIIFVVDSNDRDRVDAQNGDDDHAKKHLHETLAEELLQGLPLLVLANKQDLKNAMKVEEVADRLGLHALRDRPWYIHGCCAVSGDGVKEGIEWLTEITRKQKQKK